MVGRSSGVISGSGLASANTIGSVFIRRMSFVVRTLAAETPMNTSALATAAWDSAQTSGPDSCARQFTAVTYSYSYRIPQRSHRHSRIWRTPSDSKSLAMAQPAASLMDAMKSAAHFSTEPNRLTIAARMHSAGTIRRFGAVEIQFVECHAVSSTAHGSLERTVGRAIDRFA